MSGKSDRFSSTATYNLPTPTHTHAHNTPYIGDAATGERCSPAHAPTTRSEAVLGHFVPVLNMNQVCDVLHLPLAFHEGRAHVAAETAVGSVLALTLDTARALWVRPGSRGGWSGTRLGRTSATNARTLHCGPEQKGRNAGMGHLTGMASAWCVKGWILMRILYSP